ncbi:MAG: ATP-binding protein [Candidatus Palauibacterales bacterium]|nr:ATP-binding protein [Candidatus Palauibacterales bacterium]MDP2530692.1 ATP-binding protein [Candidatus Palauibacterales bacterium]
MSRVIEVPSVLDERGFERLVSDLAEQTSGEREPERILFDARRVRWTSPYGLVGLLAVGDVARGRTGLAPSLSEPEASEVRSYWERMDFWQNAAAVFDLPSLSTRSHGESDALLELTPIRSHQDVHRVVERVRERAATILERRLHYPKPAVIQFSVMLSEVCQNILEHAEGDGWVCAQTYFWKERLGRDVLVLAVMDVGQGFEGSLAAEHARRFGDRWSSATALEAAFLNGESRFRDPGRGQGLQAIRRQVTRWDGEIRIRSGDAMIARVPEWDDIEPLSTGLVPFPGAQILIVMPARIETPVPA